MWSSIFLHGWEKNCLALTPLQVHHSTAPTLPLARVCVYLAVSQQWCFHLCYREHKSTACSCADSFNLHLSFSRSSLFLLYEYCCIYNVIVIVLYHKQLCCWFLIWSCFIHIHSSSVKRILRWHTGTTTLWVFLAYTKSFAQPFSPQEFPTNSSSFYFFPIFFYSRGASIWLCGHLEVMCLLVYLNTQMFRRY